MNVPQLKSLVSSTALAMQAWLAASVIQAGEIFRRIREGGHLGASPAPAAVRAIVNVRFRERALSPRGVGEHLSAHSIRAGARDAGGRQNMSLPETMANGEWRATTV